MTQVTKLFGEQKAASKKIEFVGYLDHNLNIRNEPCSPDQWANIKLIGTRYSGGDYDLMLAYDANPNESTLYYGYFNDGIV